MISTFILCFSDDCDCFSQNKPAGEKFLTNRAPGIRTLLQQNLHRTLSDFGHDALALKLITQEGFPSYRYHLDRGATTLWENFIPLADGEYIRTADGRKLDSLNHHFWGDISAWFYKYIAGIRINPALQDPLTVEIAPHFIEGIDYCRAERAYLGGKIAVEWERGKDGVHVNVTAPSKIKIVRKW